MKLNNNIYNNTISIENIFNSKNIFLKNSKSSFNMRSNSNIKITNKPLIIDFKLDKYPVINQKEKLLNKLYMKSQNKLKDTNILKNKVKMFNFDKDEDFSSDSNINNKLTKNCLNKNLIPNINNNFNIDTKLTLRNFYNKFSRDRVFICNFCSKKFQSGCSLGGHITKNHRLKKK